MIGIYKITNLINGKCYIGQSVNIAKRWSVERRYAFIESRPEYKYPLSCAFRKYGVENFEFEVIEECSRELLNERECYWADYYNSYAPYGYNLSYCGRFGNITGVALSIESVKEIIKLLRTTQLTQTEIGEKFNVSWKAIQCINTGTRWHILKDDEYPIRERYWYTKKEKHSAIAKPTVYDSFPSALDVLIDIAKHGFENVCSKLGSCRKTIKNHLEASGLPTSKTEIVQYYKTNILQTTATPRKKVSKSKVLQIDIKTGIVLNEFKNGYDAGRYLGDENKRKHINEVCLGKRATAYGYIWRRVDESNEG